MDNYKIVEKFKECYNIIINLKNIIEYMYR